MSRSSAAATADRLRELVVGGDYRPGDRLPPERELAAGLGISRSTVREATGRLVESGLLEARRGSGTFVADLDLAAVLAVRLQLEPFAARCAARERTGAQVRELRETLAMLPTAIDIPPRFARIDQRLHRAVAVAAANPVLLAMIDRLAELSALSRVLTSPDAELRAGAVGQLTAVVDAIAEGAGPAAERAMRDHLLAVRAAGLSQPRPERELQPVAGALAEPAR